MNVCLVLHAHQPPGNFDSVFEHGFEVCYGPVLDLIEERPDLRLSMHWSGSLLEWTEKHRPGRIDQIRRLVQRGQVEVVLAGGIELLLGGDDFLERMHRFAAIYRRELAPRAAQVARVDLRYASGVAVAFRDASRVAGI